MSRSVLMRHAAAAWPDGASDVDRPLSEEGRAQARRMGRWLREAGWAPHRIVTSPAARAVETGQGVASALDGQADLAAARPLYEGGSGAYRAELFGAAHTVLVVGHNPAVEDLARDLGADTSEGFPPATLVCLDDGHAVKTVRPDDID